LWKLHDKEMATLDRAVGWDDLLGPYETGSAAFARQDIQQRQADLAIGAELSRVMKGKSRAQMQDSNRAPCEYGHSYSMEAIR
jgi:hypothetical protein